MDHDSRDKSGKRAKLISLLRGFFAAPVLAALGELELTDRMLAGEFSVADFTEISQREVLASVFRYLHGIGLVERGPNERYLITAEGRTALNRNGAFSLLLSYDTYLHQLPLMLTSDAANPTVDRSRNVRGSGQLHSRKFFPLAFELLASDPPTAMIDIGCGDGCFLENAHHIWPSVPLFGLDLSTAAIEATINRFTQIPSCSAITTAVGNGREVEKWNSAVPREVKESARLVISIWFVVHEFSSRSEQRVREFFASIRTQFPQARVLIGEISKISPDVLARDHQLSIMPEFLLFHELSGQGVLSWDTWRNILRLIPYRLAAERKLDEVNANLAEAVPASFVWLLEPA